jgi:hypothetical protein
MSIGTASSGSWVLIDAPPFQYVKFVSDVTVTDGSAAIVVIAQD